MLSIGEEGAYGRKMLHTLSEVTSSARHAEVIRAAETKRMDSYTQKGNAINLLHSSILNEQMYT